MNRVLLLVMGIAVQCDQKEQYIQQIIKCLPQSVQVGLMECIKRVTHCSENVISLDKLVSCDEERRFLKDTIAQAFASMDKTYLKELQNLMMDSRPARRAFGENSSNARQLISLRRSHSQGHLLASPNSVDSDILRPPVQIQDSYQLPLPDKNPQDDNQLLVTHLSVELAATQTRNRKLRAEV
ncbi:Coiled-coil domain containing [Cichlidogyrus casuarinus]|uniref:Coiled-coil domain containing n=1 Tax=Cichlidogyrus casuarinus TaxID=1844966 RepID=A0ABD2QB76_9PLAT